MPYELRTDKTTMHNLQLKIKQGDLTHPQVLSLINEHLQDMANQAPPESVHSLDSSALAMPDIKFYTAWVTGKDADNELAGCAALKMLDQITAEIKSMRTTFVFKRMGVANTLLAHLIDEAKKANIENIYLETGSMDAYAPSRSLYKKFGFTPCAPYATYTEDPNSVFMHLNLS